VSFEFKFLSSSTCNFLLEYTVTTNQQRKNCVALHTPFTVRFYLLGWGKILQCYRVIHIPKFDTQWRSPPCNMEAKREAWQYNSIHVWPRGYMDMSDQCQALAALPPLSIVQGGCDGPHGRSGWVLHISPATRFEPRNVQHVMSRCVDCAVPTALKLLRTLIFIFSKHFSSF